jgi:hypothetical protein
VLIRCPGRWRAGSRPRSTVDGPNAASAAPKWRYRLRIHVHVVDAVGDAWLWDHVIAERVDTVDATHDVQALLDTTTLDQLFDPVIRLARSGSVSTQELVTA